MDQNLSLRERRVRLGIGIFFGIAAVYSYLRLDNVYLVAGLGLVAAGFVANYFTCFCGAKKLIDGIFG